MPSSPARASSSVKTKPADLSVHLRSDNAVGYNSPIVKITIGPRAEPFFTHQCFLRKTAFFDVEAEVGPMPHENGLSHETLAPPTPPTHQESPGMFLQSDEEDTKDIGLPRNISFTDGPFATYHLSDRLIDTRDALNAFLEFLNRGQLNPISSSFEVQTSLEAYMIARRYKCDPLQNHIIDRLRRFYKKNTIELQSLQWVAKHSGKDTPCLLLQYLIEQTAFEIVTQGVAEFTEQNPFFRTFFSDKTRPVRYDLVVAITEYSSRSKDPATDEQRSWHL